MKEKGLTVIQKIVKSHGAKDIEPGSLVWIDIDIATARDFGGANVVKHFKEYYGEEKVFDKDRIFFTFDCNAPANTSGYATNQMICRSFAKEQGIRIFDVGSGIGSHIMIDEGICLPGFTLVGTDSHLNILGAIGALGMGMGDVDITFVFKNGKTWFEIPETIKVQVKGAHPTFITAKDLALYFLKNIGIDRALNKVVEFYGASIERLNLAERITIASMATELGAIVSFFPPNPDVLSYVSHKNKNRNFTYNTSDPKAQYSEEIEISVSKMKSQISAPPYPHNVHDIDELIDKPINSVFIGSCTNGRFEDIELVARIMKGNRVHPDVFMIIVPATRKIYAEMLYTGIFDLLFEAGAIISHPGCGGCASGQLGMTGKGEVQLSTGNRNFSGKQGEGEIYLVSPAVAVSSAITGKITSPEKFLNPYWR